MVASSAVMTTSIRRRSISDRNALAYGAAGPRASGSTWLVSTYRDRSAIPANRSPPTSAAAPVRASARQAASETWGLGPSTSARTPPSEPGSGGTQHLVHGDDLVAPLTGADDGNGHADLLFDELEVAAGGGRQRVEGADAGDVGVPALELLVDRLGVVEVALVGRELVEHGAVGQPVADADGDPVEDREHVQLGH